MKHIVPDRVIAAIDRLHEGKPALFADFLLMKYHGLNAATPLEVTASSTAGGIKRLMDVSRDDDTAFDPNAPTNFNPFAPYWRVREYGRTGPLSNIDGGALGRVIEARKVVPREVTLLPDYVDLMKGSLLSRRRRVPRIPLRELAIWVARFDDLDDAITVRDLEGRFLDEFRITPDERAAFFRESTDDEDPFAAGPADRGVLVDMLIQRFPPDRQRTVLHVPATGSVANDSTASSAQDQAEADLPEDLLDAVRQELVIPDVTIRQIITLLRLNKNVILTGAPGTGKTTLAARLAELAAIGDSTYDLPRSKGVVTTTATADWTTFDTIGGLVPDKSRTLHFRAGMFLRAIKEDKWLIIDEINRADVDKAFGQLFTVLSGHDVELPFSDDADESYSIRRSDHEASLLSGSTYAIGTNWRIIGTMNSFDRSHLFQLSSAFVRRFAVVNVPVPTLKELDGWIQSRNLDDWVEARVRDLVRAIEKDRPLGPAILRDVIEYIAHRLTSIADPLQELALSSAVDDEDGKDGGSGKDLDDDEDEDLDDGEDRYDDSTATTDAVPSTDDPFLEAVVAYVLPQLDGLDRDALKRIRGRLSKVIAASSAKEMDRQFRELFEL